MFLCCEVKGSREERGERGGFVMICLELRFGTWEVFLEFTCARRTVISIFVLAEEFGGIFAG